MKNQTGKYFKYAIGEIVLVVIGILIALQINNWNESRKEQNKERNYLTNLQRDLKNQIKSIDIQTAYETEFTESAAYIIQHYKNHNALDDLDRLFFEKLTNINSRKTFLITDPTFTDLLSSGNIDLIKNKSFKDQLIQYYQELERIEKVIQNNNTLLVDNHFGTTFLNSGYFYNNTNAILPSTGSENSIALMPIYHDELAKISSELLNNSEKTLQLMNVVNLRHTVSLAALGIMENSKKNTLKIIEELNRILNE